MIKHYSNNIQNIIQKELFAAKHSIKICVAWFTNDLLFQPLLLKLNAGVKVELILNKDEINISDTNEVNFDLFIESGGHLYWNESSKLLHYKFCVIDDNVVISGSYNWTNGAEYKNYELITLFKDEAETTTQHLAIFEELTQEFPLAKVGTKAEQNHANITTNKSPIPSQQPTYYKVGKFIDGLAIIYRLENGNRRYGFINENNVLVIPCKYESVEEFHNGLSFVCLGHYFGAIDKNGMEIIPFQHKSIRWRNNNFIEAYFDNDELCIYDNSGIRIANNRIIVYTSIDGKAITPDSYSLIILSNTYQCGKGIIIFSNAIKQFSGIDWDEFNNSVYNDWASYDDISGHVSFLGCHRLSSISIPSGITSIGNNAFAHCQNLARVYIPNSITSIGWRAFEGCSSLMNITISNSVTEIGGHAFEDCISLIGVTIPDSVTKIGDDAFRRCSKLTSVTIPNSVTTIGDAAFADCDSLKEFKGKFAADSGRCLIVDGVLKAFATSCGTTKYTIPESITEIGRCAFANCSNLTHIIFPDSVTKIGWGAFSGCSSLKSITIPNSVASIAGYAFSDCSNLICVTISNSVNKIEDCAFKGCSSLTNITIPKGVTEIGWHAFENCTSLLGVAIPDSVTEIGWHAFENCTSLLGVAIPDSVTKIEWGAFENCTSIVSITIPNGVTEIGVGVFGGCYNIRDFKGKFAADGGRCLIKDNTIIAYAGDSGTTYTIPKGVTAIGNNTFRNVSSLLSVTIPDSIFEIDGGMFNGCCNIKEFKGKFAADGGRCLIKDNAIIAYAEGSGTKYTIPSGVTQVVDEAFINCSSLTLIKISDGVTGIGSEAFRGCTSLRRIVIPDSVTSIGESAFKGCSSLIAISIPASVEWLGGYAFYDCIALKSIRCNSTTPPYIYPFVLMNSSQEKPSIYVPVDSVDAYKTAEGWSDYADYIFDFDHFQKRLTSIFAGHTPSKINLLMGYDLNKEE